MSVVLATGAAMAGEGYRGFSFGVIGNAADFTTVGSEKDLAPLSASTQDGELTGTTISKSVEFPSFFVEYSWGSGFGGMTVGIEHIPGTHTIGTKTRTDSDSAYSALDDDGTYTGKAEVDNLTTIYFEPALMVNDSFGLYLKGGAAHMTVNTLESIAIGLTSSAYGNKDILGGMYGIGVKGVTPWGLFVKLEATKTKFDAFSLESSTGNKNIIHAKPEIESVRLALGYNF